MRKNNVLLGAALVGGFLLLKSKPVEAPEEKEKEDDDSAPYVPKAVKVGIFADRVMGESPLTINFRLDTKGKRPLKIVNWSFGDGETSNLVNPSHTFQSVMVTEVFHVDVTAIAANDDKGSGRLNITVLKDSGNGGGDAAPYVPPIEETMQNLLETTQFSETPTSITNALASEIIKTRMLSDSEVISLALQNQIPVYEGGFTVSRLKEMLGIS